MTISGIFVFMKYGFFLLSGFKKEQGYGDSVPDLTE